MLRRSYFLFFWFLASVVFTQAQDSMKVYIFLHEDCPISQYFTLQLNELHEEFSSDQIKFVGLFPNFTSKKDKIEAFREKYNIRYELKTDYFKTLTREMYATITPEVFVYNENTDSILYQGRIDNSFFRVGKRRSVITSYELKDALESIRSGKEIKVKKSKAVGCFINFNDSINKK